MNEENKNSPEEVKDFELSEEANKDAGEKITEEAKETAEKAQEEALSDMLEKAQQKRQERKKKKRKKRIKLIVISVICILLAAVIACGTLLVMEINGHFSKGAVIEVENGFTATDIAQRLEEAGVIESADLFIAYCKYKKLGGNFKFGTYEITAGDSYAKIAEKLSGEGKAVIKTVTVPEGIGIYDYVKKVNDNYVTIPGLGSLLEKEGICTKADFFEALKNVQLSGIAQYANVEQAYLPLEGYLFPDTYQFYAYNDSKECAALAVEKMLSNMNNKFTDQMKQRAEEINMSVNEVLTLASIIQLEAGNAGADMPKVAAVFYNRMNRGEWLGSSPTGFYGKAFENDDGRYNTNDVKGLPPGPICTVSIKSIEAVLYPQQDFEQYFYFVTDSSGKFYYNETYDRHINTINRLKRENKWIYESYD